MKKNKLLYGIRNKSAYLEIPLKDLIGKKITGIEFAYAESANDPEPMTILLFEDGTKHGFVHPSNLF